MNEKMKIKKNRCSVRPVSEGVAMVTGVHSSSLRLHHRITSSSFFLLLLLLPAPSHYISQDASVWAGLGCSSSSMFLLQVAEADRKLLLVLNRRVKLCPSLCVFSR